MLLAELRAAGFSVANATDSRLIVSPASRLTQEQRAQIQRHKPAILRELAAEAAERRQLIAAAAQASSLEEWRAALVLGHLHVCGNCSRYAFGADPAGLGSCALHGDGFVAFAMPIHCPDFKPNAAPPAPVYPPRGEVAP
jgi:hypothetical protein